MLKDEILYRRLYQKLQYSKVLLDIALKLKFEIAEEYINSVRDYSSKLRTIRKRLNDRATFNTHRTGSV